MSDQLDQAMVAKDALNASAAKCSKAYTKATGDHEKRVGEIINGAPIEVVHLLQQYSPETCKLVAAALHVPHWPITPEEEAR